MKFKRQIQITKKYRLDLVNLFWVLLASAVMTWLSLLALRAML